MLMAGTILKIIRVWISSVLDVHLKAKLRFCFPKANESWRCSASGCQHWQLLRKLKDIGEKLWKIWRRKCKWQCSSGVRWPSINAHKHPTECSGETWDSRCPFGSNHKKCLFSSWAIHLFSLRHPSTFEWGQRGKMSLVFSQISALESSFYLSKWNLIAHGCSFCFYTLP